MDRNSAVVPLSQELYGDLGVGVRSKMDLVMNARFRGGEAFFIIHVENQASPQKKFPNGMFPTSPISLTCPVYPVVIFSYDSPRRLEPDRYTVEFPGNNPAVSVQGDPAKPDALARVRAEPAQLGRRRDS